MMRRGRSPERGFACRAHPEGFVAKVEGVFDGKLVVRRNTQCSIFRTVGIDGYIGAQPAQNRVDIGDGDSRIPPKVPWVWRRSEEVVYCLMGGGSEGSGSEGCACVLGLTVIGTVHTGTGPHHTIKHHSRPPQVRVCQG